MSEKRILALEELTAHQTLTIEELSAEVALQSEKISKLESGLRVLAQRFASLEAEPGDIPANQKPPHW